MEVEVEVFQGEEWGDHDPGVWISFSFVVPLRPRLRALIPPQSLPDLSYFPIPYLRLSFREAEWKILGILHPSSSGLRPLRHLYCRK